MQCTACATGIAGPGLCEGECRIKKLPGMDARVIGKNAFGAGTYHGFGADLAIADTAYQFTGR